ncbi:hypothetical protein SASPL_136170 [Salvia splendens]|uniref:Myb/SANT-like domain-containing protein n=1 Tax=Salvia splendens TaxID=180675 RepID=A0A8X8X1M5_SALSN|nr:hypothetical protein SASPL_136170 [Salvia splendens]
MQSGALRMKGFVPPTKRPMSAAKVCSIGSVGMNSSPRQKFRKGDQTRRMWTPREEEIMAVTLLELVARGWKSDNGFRAGYLTKIEDSIRAEFPDSDIRGNPHVNSKISAWNKSYGSLRNILSRTGIGFNSDGKHKIEYDDEQWEQIVQADKEAKFMRPKSWPLWDTWKIVFGNDRAGGGGAEQLDGAAAGARSQQSGGSQSNDNYYYPSFDDFSPGASIPVNDIPDVNDHVSGQSEQGTSANKASSLKGKNVSGDTAMTEFLANLHSETNARLEVISSRIGYEFDLAKAREDVFEKLCTVDGLTLAQRYQLCNILGDKPQRLHIFTCMPEAARLGYVLMLIDENRRGI